MTSRRRLALAAVTLLGLVGCSQPVAAPTPPTSSSTPWSDGVTIPMVTSTSPSSLSTSRLVPHGVPEEGWIPCAEVRSPFASGTCIVVRGSKVLYVLATCSSTTAGASMRVSVLQRRVRLGGMEATCVQADDATAVLAPTNFVPTGGNVTVRVTPSSASVHYQVVVGTTR